MNRVMTIVIENAKQTLDDPSAHSSKYNTKQSSIALIYMLILGKL